MTLELIRLQDPGAGSVRVFSHSRTASAHIRDHLLTHPECDAWELISKIREILPLGQRSRIAAAEALQNTEAPSQALYDLYAEAIIQAVLDTNNGAWRVKKDGPQNIHLMLGFDGVLVVIEKGEVRTAFIAGAGLSAGTRLSKAHTSAPLPRESGMRTRGKRRRKGYRRTEDSDKARSRREKKKNRAAQKSEVFQRMPTIEEEIFEKVFLPALDFVRAQPRYAFDMYGQAQSGRRDYGILNESLPKRRLRFADWEPLRRVARSEK